MFKDFKDFIMRGNVLDLAVAVIIGAAFGKIITSFVNDILMPPIGMLTGGINFADLFISLNGKSYPSLAIAQAAGAPTINYGTFLNNVIDFVIIALSIFIVVRIANRMTAPKAVEPAAPTTKECPYCCTEIPLKASRCPNCTSQL